MKLYSYVLRYDTGFAPNPFGNYCTLAACTPNHKGIKPANGDWIIGTTSVTRDNKLVYAMQVDETLDYQHYFDDPRFQNKKPVKNGSARQRAGDNIYFQDANGQMRQYNQACFHTEPHQIQQDLRHPHVFIGQKFYYFGKNSVPIPLPYQSLIWKRQGIKCRHDPNIVDGFLKWLCSKFRPGIHGEPYDCPACESSPGPIDLSGGCT